MPKICCCICFRRTDTNKQRARIGTASVWPMVEIYAAKVGLDMTQFSKDAYICMKCHATVSHNRMSDRGPNKKLKICQPSIFNPIINKDVLRGYSTVETGITLQGNNNLESMSMIINDESISGVSTSTASNNAMMVAVSTLPAREINCYLGRETVVTTNEEDLINSQSSVACVEAIDTIEPTKDINEANEDENVISNLRLSTSSDSSLSHQQSSLNEAVDVSVDPMNNENVVSSVVDDQLWLTNSVQNGIGQQSYEESQNTNGIVTLPHIQGTKSTQSRCFICDSVTGRNAVPWVAIQQVWFEKKIFVSKSNRTCNEHLNAAKKFNEETLRKIEASKQSITVKISDFELWLREVSDLPKSMPYNFDNDGIVAEKYRMLCGISKENFDDLVTYLSGMRNTETRSIRNALAMFLMLLRNNTKQEVLAYNFSTSQQVVSQTINTVSATLEKNFVPLNLGYHHITRDDAIQQHSIKLTSDVLGQMGSRLCIIADCTYNYIEKPSDFELQRKTFSAHKKRNLLKPLFLVFPTGYFLEAAGLYFCDAKNNDAANIRHHYKNSDILLFMEEDDFFIFDRGFRDVVDETTQNGQSVFMPSLLTGKRTHFTCEEANSSRKVTMNRWVVEAVNARYKNVFPFFKHTIEGTYVPKIMRFNRIACAIINKYFPPLFNNKEFHEVIANVSQNQCSNYNKLKDEIENLGIQRMTTKWKKANENSIIDFPELSMDDLKRLTLGSYQIKIAEKYVEQHLREESHFGIFVHRENDTIIRARIQSRFSKSKTHNTWVKFDNENTGLEAIKGYYCSCKVGERTLGCCSHVTTVIRYLGHDRHQPPKVRSRTRLAWNAIDCSYDNHDSDSPEEDDL